MLPCNSALSVLSCFGKLPAEYLQLLWICPAHLRYQHSLLLNWSRVKCLGFFNVNPGPRFLSALIIVEYPSCVTPLLNCVDPPHCLVPHLACLIPMCIYIALWSLVIHQNIDHFSMLSSLYASNFRSEYDTPLFWFTNFPSPSVCLPSWFLVDDFCYVYPDYDFCLPWYFWLSGLDFHSLFDYSFACRFGTASLWLSGFWTVFE